MSKKKNTLKDLDEFLKQQAATLVEPATLKDKIEPAPTAPVAPTSFPVTTEGIIYTLKQLRLQEGGTFRKEFYDVIIQTVEGNGILLPEDKMLINTALYLKHGDQWKEAIKNYWKGKH